jgi:hypothetical protein
MGQIKVPCMPLGTRHVGTPSVATEKLTARLEKTLVVAIHHPRKQITPTKILLQI